MTTATASRDGVTILLSTCNGSRYLAQQLDSLYRQTYPEIRILVRDDGSTDATRDILEAERARGRIEVLAGHANLGPALSFFELLRHAASTGTGYAAFCDQDDVWHPDKIARAVTQLDRVADGRPALYCSRAELVDQELAHLGYTRLPRSAGFGNALVESIAAGCTMVLNSEALRLVGRNLPERAVIHDWWCYLAVSCLGEVIFDSEPTLKYRQHGSNAIGVAGGFTRLARKYRRFFGGGGRSWISGQAAALLQVFGERIPAGNRRILDDFAAGKSSLPRRVKLSLSRCIWRQQQLDDLLLRVLILLNRY